MRLVTRAAVSCRTEQHPAFLPNASRLAMYAEHESRKMYVSGAKHIPELAFLAAMHASSSEAFPMFTEYNI